MLLTAAFSFCVKLFRKDAEFYKAVCNRLKAIIIGHKIACNCFVIYRNNLANNLYRETTHAVQSILKSLKCFCYTFWQILITILALVNTNTNLFPLLNPLISNECLYFITNIAFILYF